MTLLIDTNILLDVLMDRQPFTKESAAVWKLCETGQVKGYVSVLSFANIVYIMRKTLSPGQIKEVLRQMSLIFEFSDFSSSDLSRAAGLEWKDFEDAIQSVTADRLHADYLVTRNKKDFAESPVCAVEPAELLSLFGHKDEEPA